LEGLLERTLSLRSPGVWIAFSALLAGCATAPPSQPAPPAGATVASVPAQPPQSPAAGSPPDTAGNPPFYDVMGERYHVLPQRAGYTEQGVASWYGREFHGRRTSSGEVYDMYGFTAAHKTLPLPTTARVTSLTTGKSIVVRINDRGPFKKGRLIDLSYGAARELGFLSAGTDVVQVQALAEPAGSGPSLAEAPATARMMYVQVGAFSERQNAEDLGHRLRQQGLGNVVIRYDASAGPGLYRVRIGPVANAGEYDAVVSRVTRLNVGTPRLVTESGEGD
jgi:rare lipoprotein A